MPLGRRAAGDYLEIVGEEQIDRLRAAAEPLAGARVLHLAAAGSRLRSPEVLPSLLSLYEDLGITSEFKVLAGERPLWRLTRQLEDGLQGGETAISDDTWGEYLEDSPAPVGYHAVVAHGPGPLAAATKAGAACVWRCELDCSNADPGAWSRVAVLADACDAVAMPATSYAPPGVTVHELAEAIDPLAPGSIDLPVKLAGSMVRSLGVDLRRPCCFQARPFDTWQDPHEVIDAFTDAGIEGLQLVLAGDPQNDDVEAWRLLREVSDYAETRDDLLILRGVGDVELNALRALARAGITSALARGSELDNLETLWKRTPVVPADPERLAELINDPGLAIELGTEGRERVRDGHLITLLAENELRLLASFQSA